MLLVLQGGDDPPGARTAHVGEVLHRQGVGRRDFLVHLGAYLRHVFDLDPISAERNDVVVSQDSLLHDG